MATTARSSAGATAGVAGSPGGRSPPARAAPALAPPVRRLFLLVSLLAALPAAADEPPSDPRAWTIVSSNSVWEARQEPAEKGPGCRIEVLKGSTVLWAANKCLGDRNDSHFVSNDGLSLIVVRSFPPQRGAPKEQTGLEIYRRGVLVKRYPVGRFVVSLTPLVMAKKHFYWLEGVLGQQGVPPGYSKDGKAVELTTLDRRSWSVGFNGTVRKIDMPKPLAR